MKSGYHAERNRMQNSDINNCSSSFTIDTNLWKHIWNAKVNPKIRNFIWKACKNGLPTKHNLYRRGLTDSHSCPICHEKSEDVEHLLLLCPWTRPIWFGSQLQWTPTSQTISRFDLWLQDMLNLLAANKGSFDQNVALLFTICWSIWKSRNAKLFEDQTPHPDFTLATANRLANESLAIQLKAGKLDNQATPSTTSAHRNNWLPPPEGLIKANTDAYFDESRNICAVGIILRDDQGIVRSGAARILPATSILHAESLALKEAHILAINMGIKHIIFESDNQDLVAICKEKSSHWQIYSTIKEIKEMKKNFEIVAYSWCNRNANQAADEIAHLCKSFGLTRYWATLPPPSLQKKLEQDRDKIPWLH